MYSHEDDREVLYYNPIELPEKVHLESKIFKINVTYTTEMFTTDYSQIAGPTSMTCLFHLAESDAFQKVEVLLNSGNFAYTKSKRGKIKQIVGWVNLVDYQFLG